MGPRAATAQIRAEITQFLRPTLSTNDTGEVPSDLHPIRAASTTEESATYAVPGAPAAELSGTQIS